MTVVMGQSLEIFEFLRRRTSLAGVRLVFWSVVWASLAYLSWAAFKLAQVRLQPDAIATGIPGFLFRLVIRPLELAMGGFHGVYGTNLSPIIIQVALLSAICGALYGIFPRAARGLEGRRVL